ncbi:MAG: RNA-binding S4 domain-containing protein [Clostridia bacterium]|nr:RNA-binding S4 domain-containing protein [Clostridia bacterium]
MMKQTIHTEFIRLDTLLKLSSLTPTGGQAKEKIQAGFVLVNGEQCTQRGKKLRPGDHVTLGNETVEIVGE